MKKPFAGGQGTTGNGGGTPVLKKPFSGGQGTTGTGGTPTV
jgi:hypothetical protein